MLKLEFSLPGEGNSLFNVLKKVEEVSRNNSTLSAGPLVLPGAEHVLFVLQSLQFPFLALWESPVPLPVQGHWLLRLLRVSGIHHSPPAQKDSTPSSQGVGWVRRELRGVLGRQRGRRC